MTDETVNRIKVASAMTLVLLISIRIYEMLRRVRSRRRDIQEPIIVEIAIDRVSEEERDITEVNVM